MPSHLLATPFATILLEGRRSIPPEMAEFAGKLGALLATKYPTLRFRSGNAQGSDEAFSLGVASVDPTRLEIIAPYESHRAKSRIGNAIYGSPESLSPEEKEALVAHSIKASPKNKGLFEKALRSKALSAKADYLLRDTMKVIGYGTALRPPVLALFYVDLKDPMEGGTGHTIRVCQNQGIPVAFQDSWQDWLTDN